MPEKEREREKKKTGRRQTSKKKNKKPQQTQTLKPQGARLTESCSLQLPSPPFGAQQPSGALGLPIEVSGWLAASSVAGWREAMCHQELMAAIIIRSNVTGKYRRGKMFPPSRPRLGSSGSS